MLASARSSSRSRSDRVRASWPLSLLLACSAAPQTDARSQVDREPVDDAVVAELVAREGLEPAAARARVIATLQLVAAARAEQDDPDAPELTAERSAHLRRTALARLVLREEFEAKHRAVDIPAGDPVLEKARTSARYVHPRLYDVCQITALPISIPAEELADRAVEVTAKPQWRVEASALMGPIERHLRASIPAADPHACDLIARDLKFELREAGDVRMKFEHARFDLEACSGAREADGSCPEPRFDRDWVAAVGADDAPGWRGPFYSRFGLHFAFVQEVLPSNLPGDEGFEPRLRESIHREWQAAALQSWLGALRSEYAAQLANTEDPAP